MGRWWRGAERWGSRFGIVAETFQAPRGTRDIMAPESERWRVLVARFAAAAGRAGYQAVIPPMFEDLGVFMRVGESTDVVRKEMFLLAERPEEARQALRPEQTASVCRMFAQHRPATPWKAWYAGPNFRYERPQKGRYRQFDQVGAEVLGTDDPHADVEIIALAWAFYQDLGLRQVSLLLNSLGDGAGRAAYVTALRHHFEANLDALSAQSRQTLELNPLRVLDSKRPDDAELVAAAPSMVEHLSAQDASHFEQVRAGLDALAIPYRLAPRLVRGLDYYTRTTFEFAADALDAAQNAVGGGGRYDGLVADLGGPAVAGVGFALGVDRILLACDAEGAFGPPAPTVEAFVVCTVAGAEALVLTETLRRAGIGADRAFDGRSMKSQMKAADRSGAAVAVIVGSQEIEAATVTVRPLRVGGDQRSVPRADLVAVVRELLAHTD
ncbi:MAG: histidine--tRNA ligase [Acidimicrobiales bacterium]